MGRLRVKRRKHQIKTKQLRKAKLAKLRVAYSKAKTSSEKEKILEKLHKIAPWLAREDFLATLKNTPPSKKDE